MKESSDRSGYAALERDGARLPVGKPHKITYSPKLDVPDEGAYFGLNSDWGDGRVYQSAPPNKGSFFGLHSDFGKGYHCPSELDQPDEGSYFGLYSDRGNGQSIAAAPPNKGAFFGLHSDWGK